MSAGNSIAHGGRDPAAPVELVGPDLPPELQSRYEVRLVDTAGGEPWIGLFRPGDRRNPAIEITADRIVAHREDAETVGSLVRIAQHNGWERIDVEGSPEFRKAVWAAATREGLDVRGYEPSFAEQERLNAARRDDAGRGVRAPDERIASEGPLAPEATLPPRQAGAAQDLPSSGDATLSEADSRLLLKVSALTEDRKALYQRQQGDMGALEREVLYERIDENRGALEIALERALESPTVVEAFGRAGYAPDGLRASGRGGAWDGEIADAIYLVRSGLHRDALARDTSAGTILDDEAERESPAEPVPSTPEPSGFGPRGSAAETTRDQVDRPSDQDELAELFLHGTAESVAADPRLAGALQAQSAMEQHIGEVFGGDVEGMTSANLESRQMISDVLRRGLDVSVREAASVRQIEPLHALPDLER